MEKLLLIKKCIIISLFILSCKGYNEKPSSFRSSVDKNKSVETTLDSCNLDSVSQKIKCLEDKSTEVQISGIEYKKFYKLKIDNNGEHYLIRYPADFDMEKVFFTNQRYIDGTNVMEPYNWTIISINKCDPYLRYLVSITQNQDIVDTLFFEYNSRQGMLYQLFDLKRVNSFIDSNLINKIRIIDEIPD